MRSSSVDLPLRLQVVQGSIGIVSSAVGYSADDGCVAPATIKENITFGRYRLTGEEAFALLLLFFEIALQCAVIV